MPYDNVPENMWDKMDKCVADVQATGKDKEAAVAICYSSIVEGKSLSEAALSMDSLKQGARHNKADMELINSSREMLREIDSNLVKLGAADEPPATDMPTDEPTQDSPEMMMEKTLIYSGSTVKALDNGRIGGYLVRFSSAKAPDLTGDFFTAETDFGPHLKTPVLYQHGMDVKMGRRVIGEGAIRADDIGVWIEAQLEMRDEYEKSIYEMAKAGKLGWSSGTASHLVERVPSGKAMQITRWPLGLDASLTPTPAEPRNQAVTLKSIMPDAEAAATAQKAVETLPVSITERKSTMDNEEIKAVAKAAAIEAVEEMKRAMPASVNAGSVIVTKDETEQPFKSYGDFLTSVKNAAVQPSSEDARLRPLKASGMSEGVPADGGYLIPPAMAAGIYQNMFDTGAILSRVSNTTVSGNSMTWNLIDETSRASSRFGGVIGYWLGEGGTKTATAPKFKQLELKLKKVAAVCYATDELLADANALGSWLTTNVPDELRFQAEAAIVYGDGVGKPLGIVGAPGTVSVTRVDGSKIQLADVVAMYARRLGNGNFAWLINRDAMVQLMQLGSTYQFAWMPPGGLADSPYARLLGYPVIETEYCSTLGTVGDIILADLSKYQAITKGSVETASSIHVKFLTDETAFRWVMRIDGAPMLSSAITPHKGSNTQSPFVTLTSAT
jgi:HK97 family phage major capsid protein